MKTFLALLTALFVIFSFPNFNQGWMAWIALVPLIYACFTTKPLGAFALGLLSSATALFGIFYWIFEVPGFRFYHALPLTIFYALFTATWCTGISWFHAWKKPQFLFLFAPVLWVAIEFLKTHIGFMSFSWATLARSQHAIPAILQVSSLTGEYGVTFLIVLANVALAGVILRRAYKQAVITGVLIGLSFLWGFYVLHHPVHGPCIRVAVVQPAIRLSERKTPEKRAASYRRLEFLTRKAAILNPALIVWPETAIRDLKRHPELIAWLKNLVFETHASFIIGASEFVKFGKAKPMGKASFTFKMREYNSAFFFSAHGGMLRPYYKQLLVPFGEYIPLASSVSWPAWLVPETVSSLPGKTFRVYSVSKGLHVAPIICWENLFPDFVRKAVGNRANMVVHLVNDNWFGRTAAPEQHNMASVLRAVENHVPVVIASNTGPSEIIDSYGKVLTKTPALFKSGIVSAEVSVPATKTFYNRYGNVFAFFCILATLFLLAVRFFISFRNRR